MAFTNPTTDKSNNWLHAATYAASNRLITGTTAVASNRAGSTSTNGCYTVINTFWSEVSFTVWVGGSVMSTQSCVEFASDGFIITGQVVYYRFNRDLELKPHGTPGSALPEQYVNQPQ